MSNPRIQLFGLLALAAILFFINTWGYDLWPADEPRFGEVPREMMQSGDYFVPHCNGVPYKEKPPLLFWTIALVSLPVGDVTEFTARVPSGIAALLTVLFTYLLAARLFDRRVAVWSALVLMTMNFFWSEARSVRTDMLLTACMTGALVAFWRWHETRRTIWLVTLYGALTLGLYTKGPAALVFPLLLIVFFYWRRKEDRRQTHWVIGIIIAMGLTLLWYIPARMMLPAETAQVAQEGVGGEAFRQIIGRVFLGVSKAQPPWYYLFNVPAGMLPWTLFLPWILPWIWRRRHESDAMRLLLAWTIPAFIFFSISVGKRGVYLLPIYPALAMLTARAVPDLMASDHVLWRKRTACVWGIALIALGIAPLVVPFTKYRDLWSVTFILFAVCGVAFGLNTLYHAFATESRTLHRRMTVHFAALAVLAATFFFPALDTYKGASDFCRRLRELALAHVDYRLYSISFSREEYVFYSRHFHTPVLMNDPIPLVPPRIQDPKMDARVQRKIRDFITKAVGLVPLEDEYHRRASYVEGLRGVVRGAIETAAPDPEYARAFLDALTLAVRRFAEEFDSPKPAFAFVQEDDWKWILPLLPQPNRFRIMGTETVGQRSMLIVANDTGTELMSRFFLTEWAIIDF